MRRLVLLLSTLLLVGSLATVGAVSASSAPSPQPATGAAGGAVSAAQSIGWEALFGNGYGGAVPTVPSNRNPTWSVWAGVNNLKFQPDCNLVDYYNGGVLWASGTWRAARPCKLVFQQDANLVIYDAGGHPVWATGTNRGGRPIYESADLYDNGCFALYFYASGWWLDWAATDQGGICSSI